MTYIYNSLTKEKELLEPIKPQQIGLYVCGLTVYDDCHLGHGRLFIWFDVLVRYLRDIGYQVTYVRNITDIDDKIIKKSRELSISCKDLTEQVISSMHNDEKTLKINKPDFEPKVTDHLPEIIEMIKILIDKGYAYLTQYKDIYYRVDQFKAYGELANQDLSNLIAGIRVEANQNKENPLDFVLWKSAKPNEPSWPSPWGNGRPGWHIECSAMAKKYLGSTFDIHGGGSDLQFPHHQNEIAQSEAANDARLAKYWMHMGFVQNEAEKMSKSLGNFFTLKEILANYHPEILRYFILASHYRSPVNFSHANMENAEAALRRIYIAIRGLNIEGPTDLNYPEIKDSSYQDFYAAMEDDFNTPKALGTLFELASKINQARKNKQDKEALYFVLLLKKLASIFGIAQEDAETFLQYGIDINLVETIVNQRNQARMNKNWGLADELRNKLSNMGITLEDSVTKTSWLVEDRKKYLAAVKNNPC